MKKYSITCLIITMLLLSSIMPVSADSITYAYDSNNRLTLETRTNTTTTTTIRYFYDSNGNLLDKVTKTINLKTGNEIETFGVIGQ